MRMAPHPPLHTPPLAPSSLSPPPLVPPSLPLAGVSPSPLLTRSPLLPVPSMHPSPWSPADGESGPPAACPIFEHRRWIRPPRCWIHHLCKAVVHCLCRRRLRAGGFRSPSLWAPGQRLWHPLPPSVPASSRGLRIAVARGSRSLLLVAVGVRFGLTAISPTSGHPLLAGHRI
jgi:hypothetical protein